MATISGGKGADALMGTPFNDTIFGGNGSDFIQGGGAFPNEDHLYGGRGDDTILGSDGPGWDYLYGEQGDDWLQGAEGTDVFYGGSGADTFVPFVPFSDGPGVVGAELIFDFDAAEGDRLLIPAEYRDTVTITYTEAWEGVPQQTSVWITTPTYEQGIILRGVDAANAESSIIWA